jgi:hypothetical protein
MSDIIVDIQSDRKPLHEDKLGVEAKTKHESASDSHSRFSERHKLATNKQAKRRHKIAKPAVQAEQQKAATQREENNDILEDQGVLPQTAETAEREQISL